MPRRCFALFLTAAIALSALPATLAADEPERYSDRVRFQPGEHPRIWITQADLPVLRERCAPEGTHHREFERMKALIDEQIQIDDDGNITLGNLFNSTSSAFLYLITGERKYADAARQDLMRGAANTYAGVVLDWIMLKTDLDQADGQPVTAEQLAELVQVITDNQHTFHWYNARRTDNPFISPWRYGIPGTFFMSLAMLNEGVDDERFATAFDWSMDWIKNEWIPATNTHSRGIYYPGFDYYRYATGSEAKAALAWKMATGEDLFEESIQLREFIRHVFYQRDPRSGVWVHFENARGGTAVNPILPVYSHLLQDPVVRGMAQYLENRHTSDGFWAANVRNWPIRSRLHRLWERILWYDPEVPEVNLDQIPTAAYWPGNGYSSFRSGWGRDDTMLFFVAGDHVNEHQRYQQGHFSITRKGNLATTSGSWNSGRAADAGYGNRTIAANCLLVYDPEEIHWAGYGNISRRPNDGGQYSFATGAIAWGGNWREREKDDIHDVAQTVAFESQPLYDYVAGDLTNAYRRELKDTVLQHYSADRITFTPNNRPNKLTRATRQIVYLKPDLFVIFDRVDSTDPTFRKTWLLHMMDEPQVVGEKLREMPDEGAVEYDATLMTAEHGEGKLIVQRLLPEQAVVRTRGGEGFEAWNEGRNWMPDSGRLYGWEHGAMWRIETDTVEERLDDVFLHVLYTTDRGTDNDAMPAAELIERGEDPGVRVEYQGRVYEVIFQRGGGRECAGHIRITEEGRVLVDRPLATEVIPTF